MLMRAGAAVLLALLAAGCGSDSKTAEKAAATDPSPTPDGQFVASYQPAKSESAKGAERLLRKNQVVENMAATGTSLVRLPENIPVKAEECGEANAFWDPKKKTVTMCYELVADQWKLFHQTDPASADADTVAFTDSVFFHEMGHGLVSLYDLPITGREEDAVDQLSALILTSADAESEESSMAMSAAKAWGLLGETEKADQTAFADEHSLSSQRAYNMLCYMYGSDHKRYLGLVSEKVLPVRRAARCEDEYDRMAKAWTTLLGPHLKAD